MYLARDVEPLAGLEDLVELGAVDVVQTGILAVQYD
jgi:hypothetical protein